VADVTIVGTVGTNGGAIGEEEKVGIRGDLITTFCTLEAVDVEE
jgi:hypothetical protein